MYLLFASGYADSQIAKMTGRSVGTVWSKRKDYEKLAKLQVRDVGYYASLDKPTGWLQRLLGAVHN